MNEVGERPDVGALLQEVVVRLEQVLEEQHELSLRLDRIERRLGSAVAKPTVERVLTKREAAAHLRCSERTVDRFRADGILPSVKPRKGGKRKVLFRLEDVEAVLRPAA